jgi:hypothetical protein
MATPVNLVESLLDAHRTPGVHLAFFSPVDHFSITGGYLTPWQGSPMSPEHQPTAGHPPANHPGRHGVGVQLVVDPGTLLGLLDHLRQIVREAVAEAAARRHEERQSPPVETEKADTPRSVSGVELPDGASLKATDLR